MKIFVHGLGQTADAWQEVMTEYVIEDAVICPELFQQTNNDDLTYDELYISFVKLCHQQPIPLDLCGLSLGGVLALNYALDYPERVNSLVLIATQYKMPKFILKCQNIILKLLPNGLFTKMDLTKKAMIHLCQSIINIDFTQRLSQIKVPVLVICGSKDIANLKASKLLARQLPDARLVVVNGGSHELNTNRPKELASIINTFYQSDYKIDIGNDD